MTETTAAHTAQELDCTKVGSVGTPLPFCKTKVSGDATHSVTLFIIWYMDTAGTGKSFNIPN